MRRRGTVATIGVLGLLGTGLAGVPAGSALAETPDPEVVVLASDFEDDATDGWFGRGDAEVEISTAQAHTGAASLLTTGRDADWHGPGRDLREILQPDITYQVEAYVRLADADAADLHLTVQRRPAGGDTEYERVDSDVVATGDEWVRLAGSYQFSSSVNDELELYVESPDQTVSFYLDDVRITTTELPDQVLIGTDFESGTTEGWVARDTEQVEAVQGVAASGEWSLGVRERDETWHGPALDVTEYVTPGASYGISAALRLADGEDPASLRLSLQTDADGDSSFTNLTPNATVTADEWTTVSAVWTPAGEADAFTIYAESNEALVDFHLDDFVLTGVTPPEVEDISSLHEELAEHFPLGAAIDARETSDPSAELLLRHFDGITAENHMKPEEIQPVEGTFTFDAADELVAFADDHDLRVYGHTLVWHSQTADWVFEDADGNPLTDSPEHQQLLLDRMQTHIEAVAERYGDRMWAWDVVNEAIDESQDDGLRRSEWYRILGPDYLAHAFHFARDAFGPDVQLYLNDYNTEFPAKREAMFQVVSDLLDAGVPLDGVGHQLHLNLVRPVAMVEDTLERFRELPVQQAVTELDVSISQTAEESLPTAPPERLVRQGYYFRDLFDVLRAYDDVLTQVTAWGLHDGRSWLRTWPVDRPHEAPLFFDDQLQSKPAYWGVVDPDQLPHFPQSLNVPGDTVEVDGERELGWQLLPDTALTPGGETGFQVRWDTEHLYVLAEVTDEVADSGDRVELYVDDSNAKAGDYQEGDAHYTVERDGTVTGDGAVAEVLATDTGYQLEAALPLVTDGEQGREVGFDIRVTDGATGEQLSWSDQSHEQDSDTSRWGTLSLIEPLRHVDVPFADTAPVIDGEIDPVWETAPSVATEVLVEGSADGAQAEVRLLWDDDRLYLLAEVADPHLDASNSNSWEQDSIEIFVDPNNTKSGPYQADDGQYRINFENHQTINGMLDVIGDNLTSETAVVDGGYRIEASVELNTMEPEPGSFVGLELQINDATDGSRTSVHNWHDPTGQSYQDTSRWGVARLVAADDGGPDCDRTIDGRHTGPLTVSGETLCLTEGAEVFGPLTVRDGGSLIATGAVVRGPVSVTDAVVVQWDDTEVSGPVTIAGATGLVELAGNRIAGPVTVAGNQTGAEPIVISGNTITGLLHCRGNDPAPVDGGVPNSGHGPRSGQCAGW
ncbi:endo-1,4-beta-xylanase [Natronosporangium hydrolyticum]|uniref:Beta-xylanase n=1 Tax=Natronosporangium hydrolyticum TaxID=2811111 RepID=A0A895YHA7_9ACTN|nr:endo-1,4-beta-xylanase [Natronosporangium hydrolyticum]QSB14773.1 endo-1,4-beta-xylanase [Natronosporangium hydrolyticum]